MSQRSRRRPGFYASLLSDDRDRGFRCLKYRPKVKSAVMSVYEVERIGAKKIQGRQAEYFIQWRNYSPAENTWETANHLSEDLIAIFENRYVDPVRIDECRERLALLFENGLKGTAGLPQDHNHAARCSSVNVFRFTIRSPTYSVPHQSRGTYPSRSWPLPEEVFDSDRRWLFH